MQLKDPPRSSAQQLCKLILWSTLCANSHCSCRQQFIPGCHRHRADTGPSRGDTGGAARVTGSSGSRPIRPQPRSYSGSLSATARVGSSAWQCCEHVTSCAAGQSTIVLCVLSCTAAQDVHTCCGCHIAGCPEVQCRGGVGSDLPRVWPLACRPQPGGFSHLRRGPPPKVSVMRMQQHCTCVCEVGSIVHVSMFHVSLTFSACRMFAYGGIEAGSLAEL